MSTGEVEIPERKYIVRSSAERDLETFDLAWHDILAQEAQSGTSGLNHAAYRDHWLAYMEGQLKGVALTAEWDIEGFAPEVRPAVGFLAWGSIEPNLGASLPLGTAFGFGTWISPAHRRAGLGARLREFAILRLRDLGFKRVIGAVSAANAAGLASTLRAGFHIVGYEVARNL